MALDCLIDPKSIAVVGASPKPSIGRTIVEGLGVLGFAGAVYPVNPRYGEVSGRACYGSLSDLPEKPDLVCLCLSSRNVLETLESLAKLGVRAAVIYDSGFSEQGEHGRALQARVAAICRESGIALCGPNCMGVLNPTAGSTSYILDLRDRDALVGEVGLVAQSGQFCNTLLTDARRYGFSVVISSGNEATLTTADYLDYLVDHPATRIIGTFTESVRDPDAFIAALDRAADAGKPVVALKAGKSERSKRAIVSHTGGLAGESRVFSQVLRAHRAIEVDDSDEFSEVVTALQSTRQPRGRRIAVITSSGGHAEHVLDMAESLGIDLPAMPDAERARIEEVVGPLSGDGNPADVWGDGNFGRNFQRALEVVRGSEAFDAIVYCGAAQDGQPIRREDQVLSHLEILATSAQASDLPHYSLGTLAGRLHSRQVAFLRDAGIAGLTGTRIGLRAIDLVGRRALECARTDAPRSRTSPRFATPGTARKTLNEYDAKHWLARCGIHTAREKLVSTLPEALGTARDIGFPVVLKAISDEIAHKSEYGLVEVGLRDAAALSAAWDVIGQRVAAHAGEARIAGYLVQEMVGGGVEVFVGVSRDRDFGPVLAFGMGGVMIDMLGDFALRTLPLRNGDASALLDEVRGVALLRGFRGKPACDIESLIECIEAVADFAHANRDTIDEIDVNPIIVLPAGRGYRVVDALIVPARNDHSAGAPAHG